MKNPYEMEVKLNTLVIHANGVFTEEEYNYMAALSYLVEQFEGIQKDKTTLCLNLNDGNFLVFNHNKNSEINPIAFVSKTGEIFFDVNISVFKNQIKEFQKYVDYKGSKQERENWPQRKKVIAAIKEYKNDILDFCIHSNLVPEKMIEQARQLYKDQETEENLDI